MTRFKTLTWAMAGAAALYVATSAAPSEAAPIPIVSQAAAGTVFAPVETVRYRRVAHRRVHHRRHAHHRRVVHRRHHRHYARYYRRGNAVAARVVLGAIGALTAAATAPRYYYEPYPYYAYRPYYYGGYYAPVAYAPAYYGYWRPHYRVGWYRRPVYRHWGWHARPVWHGPRRAVWGGHPRFGGWHGGWHHRWR